MSRTEIYTLSLHDALPIYLVRRRSPSWWWQCWASCFAGPDSASNRSEEHTSELQLLRHLVCRLLLEQRVNVDPVAASKKEAPPSFGVQFGSIPGMVNSSGFAVFF